jgi:hypothetical protein
MNFQDLYKKIRTIDESTEDSSVVAEPMPADSVDMMGGAGASDENVGECGMMSPMGAMAPSVPPAQQDTVSMNVSMNAQGAGGIRDLMNVLKDIQDGPDHGSALTAEPHNVEIDADPELDIAMPNQQDDNPDIEVVHLGHDEVEDEAYDNAPDVSYQDNSFMQQDLAGGSQKMTKGGYNQSDNPLTMAAILPVAAAMGRMGEGLDESLTSKLQAMYEDVKLREGEKKTMSRAAKGNEKYGKDGMKALAKAGREGKDLDKIRNKYNKYD